MRATYLTGAAMTLAMMATAAQAEDDPRWSFEAELEIGVESIVNADDPDDEITDVFITGELEAEFALSDRISIFTALTFESLTDAEDNRAFDDLGLYVGELGLSFDLDPVTLRLGKISPAFGSAWDTAPGYFGADVAEDYELEEMIGVTATVELGAGVLSLSAFYPDDTRLSDSWGIRRGRNDITEGGVGNTGKLNNFALQYDHAFEATTLHAGLLHLDRGEEETDQTGAALGMTHAIGEDIELIAEYAHFNGWEGSDADAGIATIGASLTRGAVTYSAALSQRRISGGETDRLAALGLDYAFDNGMTLSAGLARLREGDEDTTAAALSLIIPLN